MRAKFRSWGLLVVALVSVLAMSGMAAGSASAAVRCRRVAAGEPSMFMKRVNGTCEELLENETNGYVNTVGNGTPVSENILCYRVDVGEPSMYKDSGCTELLEGTGEFIKIEMCGKEIFGQGSSLQKIAQISLWIPDSGLCVEYNPSGSAAGLKAFGVGKVETPETSGDAYIGTDDAPNGTFSTGQLGEMEVAANGKSPGEEQDLVIPVAQAAIAVIVHPPAECSITQITNANLQKAFNGEDTEWSQIGGVGTGCKKANNLKRVVRLDGSGTTYQFKHYLFEINKNELTCVTVGTKLWTDLQEEPTRNVEWPESCTGHPFSMLILSAKSGGGGETEEVAAVEGSIGYANLGDARARYNDEPEKFSWVAVQNQVEAGLFEYPGTSAEEPSLTEGTANCKETKYGTQPTTVGPDQNWSGVYGGHPGNGAEKNTKYPICTLTWDVALEGYTQANLTTEEGEVTKEYMEDVVSKTLGQPLLVGKDYGEVEEAVGAYAENIAKLVASKP